MGSPGGRILLVEDYMLFRMLASEQLEALGFAVEATDTAAAAMSKLQTENGFAAAIVDVGLPDMKGDLLAAEVRVMCPDLPIVMVSGCIDDALRDRFKADDRVAFLNKPYLLDQLRRALNSLDVSEER